MLSLDNSVIAKVPQRALTHDSYPIFICLGDLWLNMLCTQGAYNSEVSKHKR